MVLIPAGSFEMGDHFNEGQASERPVHRVELDAFYMDIHEVTVGQFNQFVEESGYAYNRWQDVTKYSPGDDYPMVYVSWHDIVATAKQDAQNNESKFKWMLGGCCLIGTGMAYVAKPAPPKTALSDKSAEYVEIYEQAYESEAKKKRRLEDGRRDARHIRTTRLCRRARRAQSTAARRAQ